MYKYTLVSSADEAGGCGVGHIPLFALGNSLATTRSITGSGPRGTKLSALIASKRVVGGGAKCWSPVLPCAWADSITPRAAAVRPWNLTTSTPLPPNLIRPLFYCMLQCGDISRVERERWGEQGFKSGSKSPIKGFQQLSWAHIVIHSPTNVVFQCRSAFFSMISGFRSITVRK